MSLTTGSSKIGGLLRDLYQDQCDSILNEGRSIIVSHYGGFSLDLISNLTENIDQLLVSKGDNQLVRKRMFTILIEGMQNVRKHGAFDEKGRQAGYLIIGSSEKDHHIVIANLVNAANRERVISYLNEINSYEIEELSMKYKSVLTNEFLENEGGSGMGLITTRLKTNNQLGYSCHNINSTLDLFAFEVVLARK